jgi:hypothetical protein
VKWWPHDQPTLTSVPVVVACCLFIGAAVALTPGLSAKDRLVASLAGPAFFFSVGWFFVSLILRVFGHLRPLAVGFFYLGLVGIITGLALTVGAYLGLSSKPNEQIALEALQIAGILGTVVAAKQSLDRRGSSQSTEVQW